MELLELVRKHAPWSVSKLETLQICMRSYEFKYVHKKQEIRKSEQSRVGVVVHSLLELGLQEPSRDLDLVRDSLAKEHELTTEELFEVNSRLPAVTEFIQRIQKFKALRGVLKANEFFERQLAMTADFGTCPFFDNKRALIRGVLDHAMITADNIMVIIDHKTGRKHPIDKFEAQLSVYRLLAVAAFPQVQGVQCAINFVGEPKLLWANRYDGTPGAWTRQEIESLHRPWIYNTLNAMGRKLTALQDGPAIAETGWKCEWCGFTSLCEEGGLVAAQRLLKKRAKAGNGGEPNV